MPIVRASIGPVAGVRPILFVQQGEKDREALISRVQSQCIAKSFTWAVCRAGHTEGRERVRKRRDKNVSLSRSWGKKNGRTPKRSSRTLPCVRGLAICISLCESATGNDHPSGTRECSTSRAVSSAAAAPTWMASYGPFEDPYKTHSDLGLGVFCFCLCFVFNKEEKEKKCAPSRSRARTRRSASRARS